MPNFRQIVQRFYVRGISSAQSILNQLPGIVPRISNLVYTQRGGLSTCDGSKIISAFSGAVQSTFGPWTELFYFMPTGASAFYVGIQKDYATHLAAPVSLAATDGGAGGTFPNSIFYFVVTALDGAGGETTISNESSVTPTLNHKIQLNWTAVVNATGYRVYIGSSPGSELLIPTLTVSTNSYLLTGSEVANGSSPPILNSTQVCQFYKIPTPSYDASNIIKTLPADAIPIVDGGGDGGYGGGGAGSGGSGTGGSSSGAGAGPTGGVSGNLSCLPQIIQFTNKIIILPGNGVMPIVSDGTTGGTANITNTFVSAYPSWTTATIYNFGDIIKPTAPNGHIYQATQGGTSGGSEPTFPTAANTAVADGSVIWTEIGSDTAGNAPPGAAHGIVHAGALWVANTGVSNTADGQDGPSALRMSDINNPNSWNPINAAFIGKDDGTQIMGLASFSIAEAGIAPTQVLVVFKEFSTYVINGVFGSANFSIQQAQTDLGCISPRSIQFVPGFGIVRMSHLGIAVFDGVRDRIISEEIRPYIFDNPNDDIINPLDWNFAYFAKGTQVAVPPMYVLAAPLRMGSITGAAAIRVATPSTFTNDQYVKITKFTSVGELAITPEFGPINLDSFHSIQVTFPTASDAVKWRVYYGSTSGGENQYKEFTEAAVAALGRIEVISTAGTPGSPAFGSLTRLFFYDLVLKAWGVVDLPWCISVMKQIRAPGTIPITITGGYTDGTMRRWSAGGQDPDWDGTAVSWSVETAEVFGTSASDRTYFRRLFIRGQVPTGSTASLTVTVTLNGADQTVIPSRVIMLGAGQFQAEVPIGATALNGHATISGSGIVLLEEIQWEVLPKPSGVPATVR